jgi:tRNA G10  N-methylase Trm11
MESYLYILGRTPDLAFWELKTLQPDATRLQTDIARSAHMTPISDLGGTVKIAMVVGRIDTISSQTLAPFIDAGCTFGISTYSGEKITRRLLEDIKKLRHGSRFVEARDSHALSSVVIEKQHMVELVVVKSSDGFEIGKTAAVQPFELWNDRDYGRPHADPKSGMLPPKVSRMAVNIAGNGRGKTLLDPFCGMGTVLAEALLVGWNVVGADQSAEVIEKTRDNLRWLMKANKVGVTYRLAVSDAVHISENLDGALVDAIVTEPFMGAPNTKDVKNTVKGLEKLYIGCFREWRNVLKPGGVVVIALPSYISKGKTYFVKKVIDMCEVLGYTIQVGPIEYGRPGATVKRQFYKFIWHT